MSDDVYKDVSMLLANGVRVLLYYGDTDAVCNFLMGQKFPVQLGLKETEAERPWFLKGRLAGFKTTYAEGLTFVTVRGVGHMVPHWAPARAQYLMETFVKNATI
ncbi:Serine carboxypeptidase F41C3.5 precursor [Aphelenchoides avenae]|nr:Serine carboxypeptidase F41C3.5 precursor [Aphelenchus avenae]